MNPSTSTASAPSSLLHDILPRPRTATPETPVTIAAPVKAEVVDSIPVASQGSPSANRPIQGQTSHNPIASAMADIHQPSGPAAAATKGDKDLDKILKSVNGHVKAVEAHELKQAKHKKKLNLRLLVPVLIAVVVAGMLVAAAIFSFRQSSGLI